MTDDFFRVDPTLPPGVKKSERIDYGGRGGGGHDEEPKKDPEPEDREITEEERTRVELAVEDANRSFEKKGRSMRLHIIHKETGETLMIENLKTGDIVNAMNLGPAKEIRAKDIEDFLNHLESGTGIIFELDA
ncbi:MAG: hypothetical protein NUW37_12825 [Planctomycetes bacterium]|nr:hypothetical protein [Planctomycetota bacterium]